MRTATPRRVAARIASPTTAAVSGPRWKSYCARSSVLRAPPMKSPIAPAMSRGCWPPSVKVRTVIADVVEELAKAEIGATFNYRDGPDANLRRRRLREYLGSREDAPFLLVGEAPGYRGARISGIPFTSERQVTGSGSAEATATIVHRVLAELGIETRVLLWNVVPTHPPERGPRTVGPPAQRWKRGCHSYTGWPAADV